VIPLQFQVVCATNKKLDDLVKQGKFKEDLYQRLNVVPLFVPPLRERTQDLPDLIEHFCEKHSSPVRQIEFTDKAIALRKKYKWPGNIRELSNMIAYLTAIADSDVVDVEDLPVQMLDESSLEESVSTAASASNSKKFYDRVTAFERQLLAEEYSRVEGNVTKLAANLGMDRSHLYTKLKLYKIHSKAKSAVTQVTQASRA